MNTAPRPLDTLQRWMQEVIMHPLGIEAGIQSDAARGKIAMTVAEIEGVIERSKACTSVERLAVYGNAYFARLLECMRELFPATVFAVGEEAFDQFTLEYLQAYPPHSYTLDHLSDRFVDFLEETRPDREEGEIGVVASWTEFVVDLARLEWTIEKVFDGPGVESSPRLSAEDLQAIPHVEWPHARIQVAPCLRLLVLRFPVNAYYTEFRKGAEPDYPEAAESFAAISRRDYIVRRFDLSRPQFALLSSLSAGETIEEAIAAAAEAFLEGDGDEEQLAASLPRWFQAWTAEGFFVAVA